MNKLIPQDFEFYGGLECDRLFMGGTESLDGVRLFNERSWNYFI